MRIKSIRAGMLFIGLILGVAASSANAIDNSRWNGTVGPSNPRPAELSDWVARYYFSFYNTNTHSFDDIYVDIRTSTHEECDQRLQMGLNGLNSHVVKFCTPIPRFG